MLYLQIYKNNANFNNFYDIVFGIIVEIVIKINVSLS